MLELKSLDEWSLTSPAAEPTEKIKGYTDYVRSSYFKANQLTSDVHQGIYAGVRDFAVANDLLAEDAPEEEQEQKLLELTAPRASLDKDARFLLDHYALDFNSKATDADSIKANENAATLRRYFAAQQVNPNGLAELEPLVAAMVNEDPDSVRKARQAAVDRGDIPMVALTQEDGSRFVYDGSGATNEVVTSKIDSLLSSGALDTNDFDEVSQLVTPVNGGRAVVGQLNRQHVFNQSLADRAKKDPKLKQSLDAATAALRRGQETSAMSGGELAVEGLLEGLGFIASIPFLVYETATGKDKAETNPINLISGDKAFLDKGYSEQELKQFTADFIQKQAGPAYRADKPESGIITDSLGTPIIAQTLVANKAQFEQALAASSLDDEQKSFAEVIRRDQLESSAPDLKRLIVENDSDALAAYAQAKAAGVSDSDFVEKWVSEKGDNYSGLFERTQQLGVTLVNLIVGIPLGVGSLFGSETSTGILASISKDRNDRTEYARLMGDEFGLTFQIIDAVPQVATDILLTAGTAGGWMALKVASKGGTRAVMKAAAKNAASMADKSTAAALNSAATIGNQAKMGAALKDLGVDFSLKLNVVERAAPLFATSFYRSASASYVSIYTQLPEDMSHADKHKNSLGYAVATGLSTATIVSGMSFLGRGGVEDLSKRLYKPLGADDAVPAGTRVIPLDKLSYQQAKMNHQILNNAGKEISDKAFKGILRAELGSAYKNFIRKTFKGAFDEGIEEAIDEAVASHIEDAALDRNTPLAEKGSQIWHGFVIGGALGGFSAGATQRFAPVSFSEQAQAMQASIDSSRRIAKSLRDSGSLATADIFERRVLDEVAILSGLKTREIAEASKKEERKVTDTDGFTADKPALLEQGEPDLGVDTTPVTAAQPLVGDLVGERVYLGGFSGRLEQDEDGSFRVRLDTPMENGATHFRVGASAFQSIDKVGLRRRAPLMTLGEDVGDIPSGTPYIIPNKAKKTRFALPTDVASYEFSELDGEEVLTIRGVRMVESPLTSYDHRVTDPDQILNITKFFKLQRPTGDLAPTQLDLGFFASAAEPTAEPTPASELTPELTPELTVEFDGEPVTLEQLRERLVEANGMMTELGESAPPALTELVARLTSAINEFVVETPTPIADPILDLDEDVEAALDQQEIEEMLATLGGGNPTVGIIVQLGNEPITPETIRAAAALITPQQLSGFYKRMNRLEQQAQALPDERSAVRSQILSNLGDLRMLTDAVRDAELPDVVKPKRVRKVEPTGETPPPVGKKPLKSVAPAPTITPPNTFTVPENVEDVKERVAQLESEIDFGAVTQVTLPDGREVSIAQAEAALAGSLRFAAAREASGIPLGSTYDRINELEAAIAEAKAKEDGRVQGILNQLLGLEGESEPATTDSLQSELLDLILGNNKPLTEKQQKDSKAKKVRKPKAPKQDAEYYSDNKFGRFRNTEEAELFASWVSEGFLIADVAAHGFSPETVSGVPLTTPRKGETSQYQTEIKARNLELVRERYPFIEQDDAATVKSKGKFSSMGVGGRAPIDLPVIKDAEGNVLRGLFTNNPLVTAAQLDYGMKVTISKGLLESITLNPSIKVNKRGQVTKVIRSHNDKGVVQAGDLTITSSADYTPASLETDALVELALRDPAPRYLTVSTKDTYATLMDRAVAALSPPNLETKRADQIGEQDVAEATEARAEVLAELRAELAELEGIKLVSPRRFTSNQKRRLELESQLESLESDLSPSGETSSQRLEEGSLARVAQNIFREQGLTEKYSGEVVSAALVAYSRLIKEVALANKIDASLKGRQTTEPNATLADVDVEGIVRDSMRDPDTRASISPANATKVFGSKGLKIKAANSSAAMVKYGEALHSKYANTLVDVTPRAVIPIVRKMAKAASAAQRRRATRSIESATISINAPVAGTDSAFDVLSQLADANEDVRQRVYGREEETHDELVAFLENSDAAYDTLYTATSKALAADGLRLPAELSSGDLIDLSASLLRGTEPKARRFQREILDGNDGLRLSTFLIAKGWMPAASATSAPLTPQAAARTVGRDRQAEIRMLARRANTRQKQQQLRERATAAVQQAVPLSPTEQAKANAQAAYIERSQRRVAKRLEDREVVPSQLAVLNERRLGLESQLANETTDEGRDRVRRTLANTLIDIRRENQLESLRRDLASAKSPAEKERITAVIKSLREAQQTRLSRSAEGVQAQGAARAANSSEINRLGLVSGDPESVLEALRELAKTGDPNTRLVAGLLASFPDLIRNTNFVIGDFNDVRFAGAFMPESNLVVLNLSGHNGRGIADVLMHEYIHAASTSILFNPTTPAQRAAVARIEQLRRLVASRIESFGYDNAQFSDALDSNDEFLTYALTDPEFQAIIKDLTPEGQRSLFRRFVEAVLELFGVNKGDNRIDPVAELLDFASMLGSASTFNLSSRRALRSEAREISEGLDALRDFLKSSSDLLSTYRDGVVPAVRMGRTDGATSFIPPEVLNIQREVMETVPVADTDLLPWVRKMRQELRDFTVPKDHPIYSEGVEALTGFQKIAEIERRRQEAGAYWQTRLRYFTNDLEDAEIYLSRPEPEYDEVREMFQNTRDRFAPNIRFSMGRTDGEPESGTLDPVAEFTQQLPEGFTAVVDSSIFGEASVRRDSPNVIFINPEFLANRIAGLNARGAKAAIRSLITHELGHIAVDSAFTPEQVRQVSVELGADQLQQIAESYYGGSGQTIEVVRARIEADRKNGTLTDERVADEWLRMQATKAATGRIYEQDLKYIQSNPSLLDAVVRAIQAFVTRITQRFDSFPSAETAAGISRAERTLRQLQQGTNRDENLVDPNRFGDSVALLNALDGVVDGDRTSYSIPFASSNPQKVESFMDKLKKKMYNLPSDLRAVTDTRDSEFRKMSTITRDFLRDFPKFRDAALEGGVDMADISLIFGTTAPALKSTDIKAIEQAVAKFAATVDPNLTEGQKADAIEEHSEMLKAKKRNEFSTEFRNRQLQVENNIRAKGFDTLVDKAVAVRRDTNLKQDDIGFDESNDVYLTRVFRFFTTKGWATLARSGSTLEVDGKTVDFGKLRTQAAEFYREQAHSYFKAAGKPYTDADLDMRTVQMLDEYLSKLEEMGKATDPQMISSLREDLNRFKPKKDIDGVFLELLGEVTDPMANAVNTLYHVGKMAANRKFRQSFADVAIGLELASRTPRDGWTMVYSESSANSMGPLAGLYMDPQTAAAMKQAIGENMAMINTNSDELLKKVGLTISRLSGVAVFGATQLGGPGYWVRNGIGGYIQGSAQGILLNPFSEKGRQSIVDSFRTAFARLPTESGQRDALLRLTELTVLNDQSQGRIVQDLMRGLLAMPEQDMIDALNDMEEARATKDLGGWMARLKKDKHKGIYDIIGKGYSKTAAAAGALDAAIDGVFKVNAYYFELGELKKFHGEPKTPEGLAALEVEAAEKVNLTFAGHSQVIDPVKSFSRTPLAAIFVPFSRWKSEMFRTMVNTVPLAMREIKQGGSMRVRGFRRLVGFTTTVTALPFLMGGFMMSIFGALTADDEEEERKLTSEELAGLREALPIWQRGHHLFARALKDGSVQYIDMTYLLPHSQLTDVVNIIVGGIRNGDGIDGSRLASYVANELIGTQIFATAADEVLNNRNDFGQPIYVETDPAPTKMARMLRHVGLSALTPGGIKKGINILRPSQQRTQEMLVGEFLGARPKTETFEELQRKAFRNLKKVQDEAVSTIGEITGGRYVSEGKVKSAVERHQNAMNESQRRLSRYMRTMQDLGSTDASIYASAAEAKFSKPTISSAFQGYRIPWRPNAQWFTKLRANAVAGKEQDADEKIDFVLRANSNKPDIYWINGDGS